MISIAIEIDMNEKYFKSQDHIHIQNISNEYILLKIFSKTLFLQHNLNLNNFVSSVQCLNILSVLNTLRSIIYTVQINSPIIST